MKIFISEDADRDLLNIHSYIAEKNSAAAVALAHEFEEKLASLSRFPSIGRDRSNLVKGIRSVVAGNYIIFYRIDSNQVTIMRVMDGRRDIDSEFQR